MRKPEDIHVLIACEESQRVCMAACRNIIRATSEFRMGKRNAPLLTEEQAQRLSAAGARALMEEI